MCDCVNIKMGSYDCQTVLIAPDWHLTGFICIDDCIINEIKSLWNMGIETTASCCGHNVTEATIAVKEKSIQQMIDSGYKISKHYNDHKDIFKAKSA